jgi:hypothetical protein
MTDTAKADRLCRAAREIQRATGIAAGPRSFMRTTTDLPVVTLVT